jgi:hypothetical protein
MKPFGVVVTSLLFLIFGSSAIAFSQEGHEDAARPAPAQEEARPAPHPESAAPPPHQEAPRPEAHPQPAHPEQPAAKPVPPAHQARPVTRQDEMKPVPHPQEARPEPVPQNRPVQQPEARPVPQPHQAEVAWQSHRAQNWASEHRTWQQRGGYRGYRIPEARYSVYFGPSHVFPIYSVPLTVVGGYPRFQYQGFWFTVVDPWPAGWGDDWYYNDNVYIVYTDGGYYLVNPTYPGVMLAVNVAA